MHTYRLEGDYRAIGEAYGRLLKASRAPIPKASRVKMDFARQCAPFVREAMPYLMDELEGIAAGSGYDANRVKAAALAMDALPACSAFAMSGKYTVDRQTLVAHNLDWYVSALYATAFIHARPTGAVPSMGCNDLLVGRMDGVNEAGLALAMAAVEGGRDQPGIMRTLAIRAALDRCRDAVSAVHFLTTIRHARTANILVADAAGRLAIVEISPFKVNVIWSASGFAAITNQFQSDEMAEYEHERSRPPDSYRRLRNLQEWFAARSGPVSARDAQDLLRAPYPLGVCNIGRGRRMKFGTIWSWTARLGERTQIDFAAGPPNDHRYRTHTFDDA